MQGTVGPREGYSLCRQQTIPNLYSSAGVGSVKVGEQTLCAGTSGSSVSFDAPRAYLLHLHTTK